MSILNFFRKPKPAPTPTVEVKIEDPTGNTALIKELLEQGKVLTSLEMAHEYNIIDIRKPISDLIHKQGMNIKKELVSNGKKHYKKYWLDKGLAA